MKFILSILIICLTESVFAQLIVNSIQINKTSAVDTFQLELPFWDDFARSNTSSDTTLWQIGSDVFVNSSLGKNPPTYKVATFDGLKENGAVHGSEDGFNRPTDSLISQPINLGNLTQSERSTVFLSFYWQGGGNGELPDDGDSLRMQWLNPQGVWITTWIKTGQEIVNDSLFKQEILQVDPAFFHGSFRLKFQSFGRPSGPFDTWHIDYIYLNKNRTDTDTLHLDRALTTQPSHPFGEYFEVTAEAFFANPLMLNQQSLEAINLGGSPHALDYVMKIENGTSGDIYGEFNLNAGGGGELAPLERRTIFGKFDAGEFITPISSSIDSQIVNITYYFNTGDQKLFEEITTEGDTVFLSVDLKSNDTIKSEYHLFRHYAYDDGIAEYAAGINEKNGKIAIKYTLAQPDTLTHIDIHFPNITPEAVGKSITIMVWSKLFPEEIVRSAVAYTIEPSAYLNEFKHIKLPSPLLVKDTIYIGFQQVIQEYIPIGFDRNNPNAFDKIYTKTGLNWQQNLRLKGAFMIRPFFGRDTTAILSNKHLISRPAFYPNPAKNKIYLNEFYESIKVYSLEGRLILEGSGEALDTQSLVNGVYSLQLFSGNSRKTEKLIIYKN